MGGVGLWLAAGSRARPRGDRLHRRSRRARPRLRRGRAHRGHRVRLDVPRLHRLELLIEPWNTASVRTAERAGYEREGLLRSYLEIGGRRRDMLLYAVVR